MNGKKSRDPCWMDESASEEVSIQPGRWGSLGPLAHRLRGGARHPYICPMNFQAWGHMAPEFRRAMPCRWRWCFCAIADEAASPASTTWEHLRQSTTRLGPYTNPDHSRTFPRSDTRPRDQLQHAAVKVLSDLDQLGQDLDLVDACYSAHSYHVFAHVMEGS